ncbi:nitrilase [Methanofollis fontis]|uniref:Nitrilase n=2 Tax=Methanofollis fontis TaxID=2052832 RepID=A0A483CMW8_9EURY|nr:nitrilase [Methanofollis fontis]
MTSSSSMEANIQRADEMAAQAASEGADLVLFPEQFLTGWNPDRPRVDPAVIPAIRGMAMEHALWIAGSCYGGTKTPQNRAIVIDPEGEVRAEYAKVHLFSPAGEEATCTPGDEPAAFTAGGVVFGLAICYDLRFPELFTHYRSAGVHCLLVPAAWPEARLSQWEALIRGRAVEMQGYAAGANAAGGSCIAGPDGNLIAAGEGGSAMAEIDPMAVDAARSALPVVRDRRPDLYRRWNTGQ